MPLGIGGGGQAGLALEVLPPPVQSALATAGTGGTILAGTYKYVVTAINANGETTISNRQPITTVGTTSTVTVMWATVVGATGYKLYKTAAGGADGTELLYKTVGAVTTDVDTSPGSPSGTFPTVNTAFASGNYTAPTKFFPFNSESLQYQQETQWRRPIRKTVDIIGAVPGNVHTEGDFEMEALEDVVVYFLLAARTAVVKAGASPNFTYTFTPTPDAIPKKTLSFTIERVDGTVFAYTGCVVNSFRFTIADGLLMFNVSIMGRDEASAAVPVPTWPTSTPFGAGMYSVEIPTGSAVTDADTFEFAIEDNAEPQYRLKNTGRGAEFIKYGERAATFTVERDFASRTDYDAFKAYTSQSLTIDAQRATNNKIIMLAPVAIKDTYEVGLSSQGDLVRASIAYQNVIDGTGKSYQVTVHTQENITLS